MEETRTGISRLLRPRSVAIVGASPKSGGLGAAVRANLQRLSFSGELYLVNPKYVEIFGDPCLSSIDELPRDIDVAVLAVPRSVVLETIEALAKRRAGAAIIFSAGFAEDGEQGRLEQLKIAQVARESGMVIVGPNCLGLINYVDGIALTFVETPAGTLRAPRGVAILSQSGAMAAVLGVTLSSRELGVSYSISTGNEAASGIEDYLEYLLDEAHTGAFGLIVEQFRQPQRFLALARRAREKGKSLVLLHPGRSVAARESAATHTGAMTSDYEVMRTLVERAGVLLVNSLEELGDVLELTLRGPRVAGSAAAVITESGAHKALTLDLCESIGLSLPPMTDATAPSWRGAIPDFVVVSNPLDLSAQILIEPDIYGRAIKAVVEDDRIDTVVLAVIQTDPGTCDLKFPPIIESLTQIQTSKPVIVVGLDEGADVPPQYIHQLRALGVSYFPSPERVFRALGHLVRGLAKCSGDTENRAPVGIELPDESGVVPEYRSKVLLAPWGIPFPPGELATSAAEAVGVADKLGYPVVLKAQSKQLPHKSEAGGVAIVADGEDLKAAWQTMHERIDNYSPGLQLDAVLVEAAVDRGVELIVGGRREPEWGPVLLVGFGGVQAELFKDVQLLPADLSEAAIMERITRLQSAPLLQGFRGAPIADLPAVAALVARVGALLLQEPRIREIDLNPVVVHELGRGVTVLDALMQIDSPEN